MSPQDRELMQQALEALQNSGKDCGKTGKRAAEFLRRKVCDALRARLAEPETPAPTLFRVNLLRLCPTLTHEQIDELAAMARLAEPDDEPVAWLHTMDNTEGIEGNEPWCRLSFNAENPFGVPGEDYSETYPVTSEPLYPRPAARKVQPLTNEQIDAEVFPNGSVPFIVLIGEREIRRFARAIERAHGITGDSHD